MKTMLNAAWKCISKEGSAPYEDPNMTQIQEFTEETNPNIICVWEGFIEETNPNITSVFTHIHKCIYMISIYISCFADFSNPEPHNSVKTPIETYIQ